MLALAAGVVATVVLVWVLVELPGFGWRRLALGWGLDPSGRTQVYSATCTAAYRCFSA